MESIKDKLQSPAFLMYAIYIIFAIVVVSVNDKGHVLLWLNDRHNPFGDHFFKYVTHFGDGLVYALVALTFLIYRYFNLIMLAIIGLVQTVIVQIGKRLIFDTPRPRKFFTDSADIFNFVDGVHVHSSHSFPSGHTATAFAVATLLICLTRNRLLQVLYMLLAILVGISRIYILQHFMIDTIAGSLIGMASGLIVWWYFVEKRPELLYNKAGLHRGLLVK